MRFAASLALAMALSGCAGVEKVPVVHIECLPKSLLIDHNRVWENAAADELGAARSKPHLEEIVLEWAHYRAAHKACLASQ